MLPLLANTRRDAANRVGHNDGARETIMRLVGVAVGVRVHPVGIAQSLELEPLRVSVVGLDKPGQVADDILPVAEPGELGEDATVSGRFGFELDGNVGVGGVGNGVVRDVRERPRSRVPVGIVAQVA